MASFESFLQVKGRQYPIQYSNFSLHQYTDSLSRPASPTLGGTFCVEIDVAPAGDVTLYERMIHPVLFLNRQVLIKNLDANTTLKVIKFYNVYCLDLKDLFDGTGPGHRSRSFRTGLLIFPQAVSINGHFHARSVGPQRLARGRPHRGLELGSFGGRIGSCSGPSAS